MEKRKNVLLNGLHHAEFKEDPKEKKLNEKDGSGASALRTGLAQDFVMNYQPDPKKEPTPIAYTENRLDGPGGVKGKPIHEDDEPERAILVMGLPTLDEGWSMSVRVKNPILNLSDELNMQCVKGRYEELYAQITQLNELVHEQAGVFFTVRNADALFETYVNLHQPDRSALVSYTYVDTFDVFQVSMLSRA